MTDFEKTKTDGFIERPPLASAWDELSTNKQTTEGENVTIEYDQTNDQPIKAVGQVAVWKVVGEVWKKELINFNLDIKKVRELSPFTYTKPIVGSDDGRFVVPEKISSDIRYNYFPIATVSGGRRPPNHLFADDELLFTIRDFGTDDQHNWQIRCFPKAAIPAVTWTEATELLAN